MLHVEITAVLASEKQQNTQQKEKTRKQKKSKQ